MANSYFRFKQFTVHQDRCAMKVTTDGCLFGAWVSAKAKPGFSTMLDIGTGTGLLSLMVAQQHEGKFTAIEIDPEACTQAKENADQSPWAKQVAIICSDIRQHHFPGTFDLVISNPPFYEHELKSGDTKKNIAHHGDQLSLDELFTELRSALHEKSEYFLLLPLKRWKEAQEKAKRNGMVINEAVLVKQSVNHDPFRVIIRGCARSELQDVTSFDEISIWDSDRQYTQQFKTLLAPYYLAL